MDERGEPSHSPAGRWRTPGGKILRFWCQRLWPAGKGGVVAVHAALRQRLLPAVGSGTVRFKGELVKIHRQQNWLQRCGTTFTGNAAGLGMAMLSTRLVEELVEKREVSNLWGLLASRPLVSERTFEILSFGVEYLLGLMVFTVTEYYIAEYQRRRRGEGEGLPNAATEEEWG